jgi:hypothetical protein
LLVTLPAYECLLVHLLYASIALIIRHDNS